MPARIHSPFLSVTVFSCRVKSPTRSIRIRLRHRLAAFVDHLARKLPCCASAGADSPRTRANAAPIWTAKQSSSHVVPLKSVFKFTPAFAAARLRRGRPASAREAASGRRAGRPATAKPDLACQRPRGRLGRVETSRPKRPSLRRGSVRPPLKWAGGKRWQVPHLLQYWEPLKARRLVEPFAGGLAVALGLMPERALLNDINPHLINFYRWLKRGLVVDRSRSTRTRRRITGRAIASTRS